MQLTGNGGTGRNPPIGECSRCSPTQIGRNAQDLVPGRIRQVQRLEREATRSKETTRIAAQVSKQLGVDPEQQGGGGAEVRPSQDSEKP